MRTVLLLAWAVAGCAQPAPSSSPSIEAAVERAMTKLASSPGVRCESEDRAGSRSCVQLFDPGGERFAAIGVETRRATARARLGAVRVENASMGPGGGGATYVGQTPDGVFDVAVTETQQLSQGDVTALPAAKVLISEILDEYRKAGRGTRSADEKRR